MATQELSITQSSYYYMGLMNILELLVKRISIIQGIYGEYIPGLKTSWITPWNDVISPIFLRFGLAKLINNAMPDKPVVQGDGSCTPWMINRTQADIQAMYHALNDAGIVFNPNEPIDATLDLLISEPLVYQPKFLRCQSMMTSYETIHEIENNIYIIIFSIYSLYKSNASMNRSPGQVLTISGEAINKPYLFDVNGLGSVLVPWDTIDSVLTKYFSQKYLDNSIFRYDITLPIHSTSLPSGTEAYSGSAIVLDVAVAGKKAVGCIRLFISGFKPGVEEDPPVPISANLKIPVTTINITLSADLLLGMEFMNPSDIDWEATVVYVDD